MLRKNSKGRENMSLEKLLRIARQEVGYLEKKSNSQLEDKTANAGSNNWTKYAKDLIAEIGAPYANGVAWCDMFVDWCFLQAFGKEKAKELLGGWSAYTPTSAQYYKNRSQWHTHNPQPGDQIFFKNAQRIHHTGLVTHVDAAKVYTIEGNTSAGSTVIENGGSVCQKSYALNNSRIAGYGRPAYHTIMPAIPSPTTGAPIDPTAAISSSPFIATSTGSSAIPGSSAGVITLPSEPYDEDRKGIDVSAYNVITDYRKVQNAGVQFAILKIIRKDLTLDKLFATHLHGFSSCNIPIIGVYNYSYASTVAKAKGDAQKVIQYLKQYGLQTTVYLDIEDNCLKNLGETLISIINAYQQVIENSGYPFGLYTGMSFYHTYIKPYQSKLSCNHIWIARYPSSAALKITDTINAAKKPDIGAPIEGWQYSSSGIIDGISGKVDLDIFYGGA